MVLDLFTIFFVILDATVLVLSMSLSSNLFIKIFFFFYSCIFKRQCFLNFLVFGGNFSFI